MSPKATRGLIEVRRAADPWDFDETSLGFWEQIAYLITRKIWETRGSVIVHEPLT